MSWWDTSQFTSIASNAIKNAQKKIDKVLDIPTEDELSKPAAATAGKGTPQAKPSSSWSTWGSPSALLSDTPKSPRASSPDLTADLPSSARSTHSDSPVVTLPKTAPSVSTVGVEDAVSADTAAVSRSHTPPLDRAERRQARRQRSHDNVQAPKKLGAKLGAVKVKKIEDTESSVTATPTADPVSCGVDLLLSDSSAAGPEALSSSRLDGAQDVGIKVRTDSDAELKALRNDHTVDDMSSSPVVSSASSKQSKSTSRIDSRHPSESSARHEEVNDGGVQSDVVVDHIAAADLCESAAIVADTHENITERMASDNMGMKECDDASDIAADSTVVDNDTAADSTVADSNAAYVEDSDTTVADSNIVDVTAFNEPSKNETSDIPISVDLNAASESLAADKEVSEEVVTSQSSLVMVHSDEGHLSEDMADGLLVTSAGSELLLVETSGSTNQQLASEPLTLSTDSLTLPSVVGGEHEPPSACDEPIEQGNVNSSTEELTLIIDDSVMELVTRSGSSDSTVTDQIPALPSAHDDDDADASVHIDEVADRGAEESLHLSIAMQSVMEQSACSDNSYVKCELPSSQSGADSSNEYNRGAPSEFSDLETGTSSDIEIISMASTYGDGNGEARMMDFVPLSRSVFKTKMRDISPDDEISLSSSQVSPGSDKEPDTVISSGANKSGVAQESAEPDIRNPLDSKILLKKLSQLTEVLEVRETKLLSMSREHSELLEVNAHLKRRIEHMEETNGDLDIVKDEFGQRLHELERKLQHALREKELVKKQYLTAQGELHNRVGTSDKMQRMVEDKDEQISSLMAEGEKLAKQQLQSNNLIKKLRRKEKEQEELTRDQREKIDSQNAELERLKAVLDSKIQNEGKHSELIKQLNTAVTSYQTDMAKYKSDAEEAIEKQKRAESAVDNSYKEIAELHKTLAAKESQIKELMKGNETQLREELQFALERKKKEALRDADHLTNQIEDMQLTISRMEKEQHRREECLRQENQDLLDKLESADKRNDDLTQSVAAATKPLLRQIENLQSSYSAQSSTWESLERTLTERLGEAQNQLASATEKERLSSENCMELSSRINTLETQVSALKQEKSRLAAELEMGRMKISSLQDERNSSIAQLEMYKANIEGDRIETRKSLTLLENKLEFERTKVETEKKRHLALVEQLNEKDQQIQELSLIRLRSTPSPSTTTDDGGKTAHMGRRSMKQDELLERALSTSTVMTSSLYDNMRNHSTTSLLENLESQVKQREGEISQLQADILEHEKTRESLTREMVKLTRENNSRESKIRELTKVQHQFKELNGRYQALLQMYGEKEEQVTELKMDLMDVKQMYKQQIDALLSQ